MAGYWDALMQEAPAAPSLWPDANQRLENPTVPDVSPGALSSIISGLTDPFRKFTQAHMAEYQPGASVQDMPQTMQALPEVAMQTIGSPAAVGGVPGMGMGIRAYHGSPHDFDRFDMSKIGTGEGAQAYGHGLYFAENPKVAEEYRNNVLNMPLINANNARLSELAKEMDALKIPGQYRKFSDPRGYELANEYDRLLSEKLDQGRVKGKMYEVNLNADPAQFLDFDKPLAEQPDNVKAILKSRNDMIEGASNPNFIMHQILRSKEGADALNKAGIPGIKYLDQGSRNTLAGYPLAWQDQAIKLGQVQPTYNYAVFNDKIIDIMKKYGLAGALGLSGAGAMAPGFGFPTEQRQ